MRASFLKIQTKIVSIIDTKFDTVCMQQTKVNLASCQYYIQTDIQCGHTASIQSELNTLSIEYQSLKLAANVQIGAHKTVMGHAC